MDDRKVTIEFSFQTIFWIIVAVLSLWLVVALREVLVAFVLAFILAMAITPLVDYLQKRNVPRTISIVGVLLAVIGVAYLAISLILPPFVTEITSMLSNKTEYISKITDNFNSLSPSLRDNLNTFLTNSLSSVGSFNFNGVITGAKGVFNGLIEIVLIFALCFYMLQNHKGVEGVVVAYIPKQHQKRTLSIYRKISSKMSSWLGGQAVLGIIIFFVVLIGLSVLKVEYALTLAFIAGILEVLPIIGPIVAGGLAVLISLTQSPILALIVLAFYVLVQQLENHILVPQVMKKSLGLNPIAVIMAIIIGGKLLGFVGILIAVPIAAAVGVLLEEFVKRQEEEAK